MTASDEQMTVREALLQTFAKLAQDSSGKVDAYLKSALNKVESRLGKELREALDQPAETLDDPAVSGRLREPVADLLGRLIRLGLAEPLADEGKTKPGPDKYADLLNYLTKLARGGFSRSEEALHELGKLLRLAAGIESEEDAETIASINEILTQKGGVNPMPEANKGRFEFDTSSLPPSLGTAEGQKAFVEAVQFGLAKGLGQEDPLWLAATVGLLLIDSHTDPGARSFYNQIQEIYQELSGPADPNANLPSGGRRIDVYGAALDVIGERLGDKESLYYQDFARTGRAAAENFSRRPPGDAGFPAMVRAIYDDSTRSSSGSGGGGGIGRFELPPLSDPGSGGDQVQPDNARAVRDIYIAFQLEQIHFFRCVDRIVDLFMAGLLPIGYDEGARRLDQFYWNADERLSEAARWSQYSRALGASGGQVLADVNPNVEFNTLLLRFISSVADADRNRQISTLFEMGPDRRNFSTSGEQARKAGRDFLANVSLYGWAGTYFTAERFARHIDAGMQIINLPQVRDAFGVTNRYQVLERVAQREFGITVNVVKHITLAEETRKIMSLLADRHDIWGLSGSRSLFTLRPEDDDRAGAAGDLNYGDSESLFRSVQYWLAVNGVTDATLNEYRQPSETIAAPSIPGLGPLPGPGGGGGGAAPGNDQLKQMLMAGQMPSMDQLRSMAGM